MTNVEKTREILGRNFWRTVFPHKVFKCGKCGCDVYVPIIFGSGAYCGYCDDCAKTVEHLEIMYFDYVKNDK